MQLSFDILNNRRKKERADRNLWMPSLCRQRLMGYADSIMELSRELGVSPVETAGNDRRSILEEKLTSDNRFLVSDSLNAVAGIMENVFEEIAAYRPMEEKKKKRLAEILGEEGVIVTDIYYIPSENNKTGIAIDMYSEVGNHMLSTEISELLSMVLKKEFQPSAATPESVGENSRVYVFVERVPYITMTGFSRITKNSETVSGDNYSILESEKGKVDILVSDGTGSGEQAFCYSEKAIELLEKMLETGYDADIAVRMLNMAFCAIAEGKNHPTLDLCSIDLYDGSCDIRKAGAAATFVKRGMDVEILSGTSLPLGISRDAEAVHIRKILNPGDFIIMVTDGVLDALDEHEYEVTMQRIISTVTEQNPEAIAERVLQTVLCLDGGRIMDDMTVIVAGFWENIRKGDKS